MTILSGGGVSTGYCTPEVGETDGINAPTVADSRHPPVQMVTMAINATAMRTRLNMIRISSEGISDRLHRIQANA
jgi:hypothetical protein